MADAILTPKKPEPASKKALKDLKEAVPKKKFSQLNDAEKDKLLCAIAIQFGWIEEE